MRNFEDKSRSIIKNNKIDKTDKNQRDQQERDRQECIEYKVFKVHMIQDLGDIKRLMGLLKKDGKMRSKLDYEKNKKYGLLKYSDEQIKNEQWEKDDLNFVIEELKKEKRDKYFQNVADKYEQIKPVSDSSVRRDQKVEIAKQLRDEDTNVLIRGLPRIGKTSMCRCLIKYQLGTNSIFIDVTTGESTSRNKSLEDFQKNFGKNAIARFIAEKELPNAELKDIFNKKDKIIKLIEKSQKFPFEFLNDYLKDELKGEKIFLFLDEIIGLAEQPEKMKYLANLKKNLLRQVQLAIVLHRSASFEDSFKEIFEGYKTHFVQSLTIEEVKVLVDEPLKGTEIIFTDDAIEKIFEFTGGRPMEINNLCWALMHPISKNKNLKFIYRAKDIEKLTSKKVEELEESFSAAINIYNEVYDAFISNEERAIINKLIKEREVPVSEIDADTVQPLIDTTLVTKDESEEIYRINGVLFEKVISERLKRDG